jgi:hypothetical protein
MRHFIANVATYTIAVLLVGGAALFAWMRSAQLVITDEATVLARRRPGIRARVRLGAAGRASYERNCRTATADGSGWDQYPGLGHTAALFGAPGRAAST